MSCIWYEQLQRASFKGVPFEVDSVYTTMGWDTVVSEYPFQDLPTIQPMGESTNEFGFSAYVVGQDYAKKRDRLARVLRGEGLLSHPTMGYMMAWVQGTFTIYEQLIDAGGIARFDITFIKAESRRYPLFGFNLKFQILEDIKAVIDAAAVMLGDVLSLTGPEFLRTTALGQIVDIVSAAENFINLAHQGKKDIFSEATRNLATINNKLPDFINTNNLGNSLAEIYKLPHSIQSNLAVAVFDELQIAFDGRTVFDYSPFKTIHRIQQAANSAALDLFKKALLLMKSAEVMLQMKPASYTESLTIRQTLNNQFKQLLGIGGDVYEKTQDLHNGLTKAHGNILEYLTEQSQSLGRISPYTPSQTEPLIFISYKLYGTTDYIDELYANNSHIKHPLLAPAGQILKVTNYV